MTYKILYSNRAISDLDELFDYLLLQSADKTWIESFFQNMKDKVQIPEDDPLAGKQLFLSNGHETKYRYIVYKKYCIFYSITEDTVKIERVIHSRRDYVSLLIR